MSFESSHNEERVPTEEEVIRALRELGKENPTTEKMLHKLVEVYEAEATAENTSIASIQAANKVATLFMKAGYFKEAFDSLDENLQAAEAEGDPGLHVYKETVALVREVSMEQMSFTE